MKFLLVPAFFVCSFSLHAQYYYNDIIGTMETNRKMQTYLTNKVKTVSADGYTPQGAKATDFTEVQEVKENGKALKVVTIANFNRSVSYNRFDDQGRVTSIIDSSLGVQNTTTYEYDNAGRLVSIQNVVKDPESEIDNIELHKWYYNKDGKPEKMWRIVNSSDSLEVRFIPDENGNPGEEVSYKRGKETGRIYYYYNDDKNRLTDIVRFNEKIQKHVPDNIITYDDADNVIQVVSSLQKKINWTGYQTWRYVYNENGLKVAEALFNEVNERTGTIRYTYTYNK